MILAAGARRLEHRISVRVHVHALGTAAARSHAYDCSREQCERDARGGEPETDVGGWKPNGGKFPANVGSVGDKSLVR